MVLKLLKEAGITLKLQKLASFMNHKAYLDIFIEPISLEVDNYIADAIQEVKVTTAVTKLRSFIGLCSVFRRFVPNSARNTALLSK